MSVVQSSSITTLPFPVRTFSVDEYHKLGTAGVLSESDRVELIEGWIVPKMIHDPSHDGTIALVDEALRSRLPEGWHLRIQSTVTTSDSEPEPDLAIVRGAANRYLTMHPIPTDIALIVEVANTSLSSDRNNKVRVYGRAGILCYWIVNLIDRRVEVYSDPTGPDAAPTYRRREDFSMDAVVPLIVEHHRCEPIEVSRVLPPL